MRIGDLVQTDDGYYGIVVGERDVLLGNGCQEIMDDEAWAKLKALPINVQHETGAASNFDLLIEGRAPCQMVDPATIERQRRFSRDICGNE